MFSVPRSRLWRPGVAILSVAVAFLLSELLSRPLFATNVFVLFLAAVAFNVWYGGLRSGLLTTMLSAIAYAAVLLLQSSSELELSTVIHISAFVIVGLLISSFHEARRRAEEAAYQHDERFRATLFGIGDGVITTDLQGRVTLMNRAAETLTGWKQTEGLGKNIEDVLCLVSEETQEPVKISALQNTDGPGQAQHATLIARDGTRKPVDNSVTPIKDAGGKTIGTVFLFRDIARQHPNTQPTSQNGQRTADRVLGLQKYTEALSNALTTAQVAEVVMRQGLAAIGASAGSIMMLVDRNTSLQVVNVTTGHGQGVLEIGQRFPLNTQMPICDAVRTGQSIWPNSQHAQTAHYPSLPDTAGQGARVAIPLIVNGQVIGGMEFGFSEIKEFSEEDRVFIVLLAQKCAQALDRARLYNEVYEQRARLQVTLSSIGDAVITTDIKGRITFMNDVAETLTGWKFDETADLFLRDVFRIIKEMTGEPDEDPVAKVMRENATVGLANHTILIAKDGAEVPIDDSGAPIRDPNGAIIGVILVFRDISERRKRETALDATLQRTQDLYETCRRIGLVSHPDEVVHALLSSRYLGHASQCAVLTFNTLWNDERPISFEVAAVSRADKPLPGFAANGSLDGSPLVNLLSCVDPVFIEESHTDTRLDAKTRDLLAQAETRSMMIFPLTAGRGCFGMLLLCFASPQRWNQEDYRHIQVFVDQICVTMDNVRLFAAEARARLDAERANQTKLRFLAIISHELRTPLTSIKGFATTLLATDVTWDTESQRKFINIINDESDKLTDLIGQLLDLSRLQAGQLRIQPELRDLSEILDTAMAQLESITSEHRLVIEVEPGLPPVMVDMQRVAEVLVNLVGNAVKYAPPATHVTISAATRQGALQVNVSDEGPGIPVENREKVFEAFLQLEDSFRQQRKGLGLGLAICKGLIEAHGGKIWIADTSSGTTVSFTLPIAAGR